MTLEELLNEYEGYNDDSTACADYEPTAGLTYGQVREIISERLVSIHAINAAILAHAPREFYFESDMEAWAFTLSQTDVLSFLN